MSTENLTGDGSETRYDLTPHTRYRHEPDIGIVMLYNVQTEEFRATPDHAIRIIERVDDGDSVHEIASALGLDEDIVEDFCEQCVDSEFFERVT